jgi:hypothetical protein
VEAGYGGGTSALNCPTMLSFSKRQSGGSDTSADGTCDAYVVLGLAGEVEPVSEDYRCVHLQPSLVLLVLFRIFGRLRPRC